MKRIIRRITIACLCLGFAPFASTLDIAPFYPSSARENGMGGTHAALADTFDTMFANPAGFLQAKETLSFASLNFDLQGPIFDLLNSVDQYTKNKTFDLSGAVGANGLSLGMDIAGPLAFGWVGRGLGFGIFNRTYLKAYSSGTSLKAALYEDLVAVGGYSFQVMNIASHRLELGLLGKGFIRASSNLRASIFDVVELINADAINNQPLSSTGGIGFDIGLLYHFADTFTVGVVCRDAYSPASITNYTSGDAFLSGQAALGSENGIIDPRLDIGVAITPSYYFLSELLSGLVFVADYRDILDFTSPVSRNPVLNISAGMEVVALDVLSFRAGLADALPNIGIGLDLSFMRLDFAVRGVELGLDPGVRPVMSMNIGLSCRY